MTLSLDTLQTPSLILDRSILCRNMDAMHSRMSKHGVSLRPHLKTAKSIEVAKLATAGQPGGITVSTMAEAEYFFKHGFSDILIAVGIANSRLERVASLSKAGADIKIITDNLETVNALRTHTSSSGHPFKILIEIDSGEGRAGVLPESEDFINIARAIKSAPNMHFLGVLTHAGHSYGCKTVEEIKKVAENERLMITMAARRLNAESMHCPIISAGSTPTAVHADVLEGITEMRPGVFVFNDLKQLSIGSCTRDDLALTVLACVIGHNRHAGHLLIDAGALALSKDISANEDRPELGYGEVCDAKSLAAFPNLYVNAVSQEHGIVSVSDKNDFEHLPIGTKVRILPNHACITAAGYPHYEVMENDVIIDRWERLNGW